MNTPVLFSVIVPTYNRAHIISDTINSILNQSYTNFELIIVDDGSTDSTEDVVRKFLSDKVFYYKKINEERAIARNYGTSKAKGDYINWFDSDDIMYPRNLEEAANTISKYGMVEMMVQGFEYIDKSGGVIYRSEFSPHSDIDLYKGNLLANSPVIVRRDIAIANPFNEDPELTASEDYELWLRLASKFKLYPSAHRTVKYICHDERSVITMRDPAKLINRYKKFLYYTTTNNEVIVLLGKHKNYFVMKNYLFLALDLVVSNHRKLAIKYLGEAFAASPMLIFERGFYAFIKHFIRHSLS